MKKTLVGLFTLAALALGIQVTQAACPCSNPCPVVAPCCPTVAPCQPACPVVAPCCPAAPVTNCDCGCNSCCAPDTVCAVKQPRCKCTWWKIFEDKTCCYKCNNECDTCCSAKRAHWYKFWTDRCVVKNVKCDKCNCKCNDCCN